MSPLEYFWPGQDYEAVQVRGGRCQFSIESTPDERIKLECDLDKRYARDLKIDMGGRWLVFELVHRHGDAKLKLKLPGEKSWTLRIAAAAGEIKLLNLKGQSQLILGRGSVQAENCSGRLKSVNGRADIKIKHFLGMEVPDSPPFPGKLEHSSTVSDEEIEFLEENDREFRGEELGIKLRNWVLDPRHFWRTENERGADWGLDLKTIRGNIQIEESDFRSCSAGIARGDLKIHQGRAGYLEADLNKGNIEVNSDLGEYDWLLKTHRGDIRVELNAGAAARVDLGTRLGNIRSEVPLVKVARQGPLCGYNNRMVGRLGPDRGGKIAELHLSTVRGNIEIKSRSKDIEDNVHLKNQPNSQVPVNPDPGKGAAASDPGLIVPAYRNTLDVLKALSEKRISVEEAEQRLRELSGKDP